jgi:hypothetical protein
MCEVKPESHSFLPSAEISDDSEADSPSNAWSAVYTAAPAVPAKHLDRAMIRSDKDSPHEREPLLQAPAHQAHRQR